MNRPLLLSLSTLILSAGLCQAAFADTFSLSLSNANQGSIPGANPSYIGTITNTSGSTINLDAIEFNFNNSFSAMDPTVAPCAGSMPCIDGSAFYSFVNGAPLNLATGTSYTGTLFSVDVPLSSAISTFSGFVDITGDIAGASVVSTIVGFSTTVTPEPSSWLLMATGLLGLVFVYRLRSQPFPVMTRL